MKALSLKLLALAQDAQELAHEHQISCLSDPITT